MIDLIALVIIALVVVWIARNSRKLRGGGWVIGSKITHDGKDVE